MVNSNQKELEILRNQIDNIDTQILELISQRAQLAGQIGQLKEGILYRPEREAQVLRRIRELNKGPLSDESVLYIFRELMSACLAHERPVTVSYLGPRGTYSEAAVMKHFGHAAIREEQSSLDDVFQSVVSGRVNFGLVPIENSTEGSVNRTLDLLVDTPLQICGEVQLRIHHQLLVQQGVTLEQIEEVYSHAQSLAQCHSWLANQLPNVRLNSVSSNAEAAKIVSEKRNAAAIASAQAAELYQLQILAKNIEDRSNNTTRFFVIGNSKSSISGHDKTSLLLVARNRPGAIHELLAPFAKHGVSLTRLESRPSQTTLWEYVFFIDLEGHCEDNLVKQALAEVNQSALVCRVLGSYPVAPL
ncbi:MAG: prephenate dehydratase [Betaproteobacteria bacterium]|uniref:prephenate dehydratase n=1 Tax=Ferrovum sp. PN-J185 TaxID=1356306 RepID=UPI00079AE9BB|nr:prephenate dehydratase [Ferrovum sp. PN-J185]KXW56876.1 prephenate dehydratase [Ferrovum sp. PN-J185]MDE1891442.1 prephenate dehydratase [Betaproteobacteria bacterium]MDE2056032.1 prephenate dehydratase [Betaproteobacteria bacterium]